MSFSAVVLAAPAGISLHFDDSSVKIGIPALAAREVQVFHKSGKDQIEAACTGVSTAGGRRNSMDAFTDPSWELLTIP